MKSGDILGHENVGEVVEVGPEAKSREVGDRVVVPFTIVCGECFFCRNGFYFGCVKAQDIFARRPLDADLTAVVAPLHQRSQPMRCRRPMRGLSCQRPADISAPAVARKMVKPTPPSSTCS